jgi:predicted glycosyltransferase
LKLYTSWIILYAHFIQHGSVRIEKCPYRESAWDIQLFAWLLPERMRIPLKILQYCQHVLGIGHFFRSMEIARALRDHEILFVEGGQPLEGFEAPPHVERLLLPPLMMDENFRRMDTGGGELDRIQQSRRDKLLQSFREFDPDAVLIELFPFGRKRFGFELVPLLELAATRRRVRVICSLRDILVEKDDPAKYEERVLSVLNRYYDLLLVHSDPALFRLEETFSRIDDVRVPIRYTGYVVRPAPEGRRRDGLRTIAASSGGGRVGGDLLEAAVEAVKLLPDEDLRLRVFPGPFLGDSDRSRLEAAVERDPRISVEPFSPNFLQVLADADLSVSMAGYNTCMDLLASGVRALVWPFGQNREQGLRAERLERIGVLEVLRDLSSEPFSRVIRRTLKAPPPEPAVRLNLNGAADTAAHVEGRFDAG